jgi:outer membrane protein OmpA-like peptidoglycan-associated protein
MKKTVLIVLVIVMNCISFGNCHAQPLFEVVTPNVLTKLTFQDLEENRLLVSVMDQEDNPVRGLGLEDFLIQRDSKKARVISVESLETSEDVGLNVVLVVDNSASMKHRDAIEPLLAALEEFFKIVRPIDNIHAVVFDPKGTQSVAGRTLHTKTVHAKGVSELRGFFKKHFDTGLSDKTYLYEAILAGVEITRKMPEKQNKLMVVFSDGEDLNSAFKNSVVKSEAQGAKNLKVYSIDFMPSAKMNPFLKSFAEDNDGRIWKASSASELLPIFKAFSTALRHQYVVTYRFLNPPQGILNMGPADLHLEMLTMLDGSPVGSHVFFEAGSSEIPSWYSLFSNNAQALAFDANQPMTAMERHYHVLNIVAQRLMLDPDIRVRIVGCNAGVGVEKDNLDLSQERAEAVKAYLGQVWGVDSQRMKTEARHLPERPALLSVLGGRAENQRVEVLYEPPGAQAKAAGDFIVEANRIRKIQIQPEIVAEYGVAHWELDILADQQPIKTLKGTYDLKAQYAVPLDDLGRNRLVGSQNLEAHIKVVDIHGDAHETTAVSPIVVSKKQVIHELVRPPKGTLVLEPANITIEELTTIDSSPLLNYVFFETGESEIHERYSLFDNQGNTKTFDESNLRSSLDKHLNVLNILAKRTLSLPDASLTIIGCNSDYGAEKGKADLSRSRAEAIRAYLKYIWGLDSSRMEIKIRNLPEAASGSWSSEGRAENQRVEIYSDTQEILDITTSTYVQETSDAEEIRVTPNIVAGYGIKSWRIDLKGDGVQIDTLGGNGDLESVYTFNLSQIGLGKIGSYENIGAAIEIVDQNDQQVKVMADSASVKFIKRKERLSQKVGYKVLEKYALILFDFGRWDIKGRNKVIVDRIIARLKEFPGAIVRIVGHTDNIGKEAANLRLSEKRAKGVYDQMLEAGMTPGEKVTYAGAGPHEPLFDNSLPEGRALNRTVTVSLEYEKKG